MNVVELSVLHHHAIAIEWLCARLAEQSDKSVQEWKTEAFRHSVEAWSDQPPGAMKEMLDGNWMALQEVMGLRE